MKWFIILLIPCTIGCMTVQDKLDKQYENGFRNGVTLERKMNEGLELANQDCLRRLHEANRKLQECLDANNEK